MFSWNLDLCCHPFIFRAETLELGWTRLHVMSLPKSLGCSGLPGYRGASVDSRHRAGGHLLSHREHLLRFSTWPELKAMSRLLLGVGFHHTSTLKAPDFYKGLRVTYSHILKGSTTDNDCRTATDRYDRCCFIPCCPTQVPAMTMQYRVSISVPASLGCPSRAACPEPQQHVLDAIDSPKWHRPS